MFADLKDSTALAQVLDLDDYDTLIRRFHDQAHTIVEGHQGDVVQVYGDGVLSVFGLKVDGEDSAFAATQAALSLAGRFAETFPDQSLRVGLHSGNVMCHRQDATPEMITGFDVNLTARIQAEAKPNGVMVSGTTYRLLDNIANVNLSSRRVAHLKGVATETELCEIKSIAFRGRVAADTALVGREHILSALEATPNGTGRAIIGPGGIGKTSVLDALSQRIGQKARVIMLCARSNVRRSPLFPFRRWLDDAWDDILALCGRELTRMDVAVLKSLRICEETDAALATLDAQKLGALRIASLCKVVRAYLSCAGGALFFDDMQWSDDQSRALTHRLIQEGSNQPFRIFVFARDAEGMSQICAQPGMARLDLPPLEDDEALDVLQNIGAAPQDPETASALLKNAAGNPLYLLSMCDRPPCELPQSIEASIQSQLDVGAAYLPTLSVAAVLGQVFPRAHLHLFQDDPLEQAHALEHLVRRRILKLSEGTISFCHPLYREVAYDMIPRRARKALHLRAALAMSKKDAAFARAFPELLADHAMSAQAWGVIPKFAIAAASHMIKQASHDQALYYIEAATEALAAMPDNGARAPGNAITVLTLRAAVEVQKYGHAHPKVIASHSELERVAQDDCQESFTRMLAFHSATSHRLIRQGPRACRPLLQGAAELAKDGTLVEQLLHLIHDSAIACRSGRMAQALHACTGVQDIYCAKYHRGLYVTIGADPLVSALGVSMQVRALQGDIDGAMRDYENGVKHGQDISAHQHLPELAILGAPALYFGGDRRRALSVLDEGTRWADAQGVRVWQLQGRVWRATLSILSGQFEGQGARLADHLPQLEAIGMTAALPLHRAAQALADQASGTRRDASLVVGNAIKASLRGDDVIWLPVLCAMERAVGSGITDRHARIEKAFRNRSGCRYSVAVPTVPMPAGPRQTRSG
mmetsp:Transcript_6999/g.11315  ORF Transcript_6999/g.11315 Transcript_6999/m.11315 type:complete len:933 (+) Transcript_6999:451-3249(+)